MITTILLIIAVAPVATIVTVVGGLWLIGFIDSFTATCVCGSFLKRGRCTHPLNHQPLITLPPVIDTGWVTVSHRKHEPLALPRGDR